VDQKANLNLYGKWTAGWS